MYINVYFVLYHNTLEQKLDLFLGKPAVPWTKRLTSLVFYISRVMSYFGMSHFTYIICHCTFVICHPILRISYRAFIICHFTLHISHFSWQVIIDQFPRCMSCVSFFISWSEFHFLRITSHLSVGHLLNTCWTLVGYLFDTCLRRGEDLWHIYWQSFDIF